MRPLHIVQGDTTDDKDFLIEADSKGLESETWITPKDGGMGDDVVIYVAGHGFFATAQTNSLAIKRDDVERRYGAGLKNIKLIKPLISIALIQHHVPELGWARYPRSMNTPNEDVANQVRKLIKDRRAGILGIDIENLEKASLAELRAIALKKAKPTATKAERKEIHRLREAAITDYVIRRAEGYCEACEYEAPFKKADGSGYLEGHHIHRVADEGPDHPDNMIALCPNCHRRAHHSVDKKEFNNSLKEHAASIEFELWG